MARLFDVGGQHDLGYFYGAVLLGRRVGEVHALLGAEVVEGVGSVGGGGHGVLIVGGADV